jgi:hypothetical protein
MPKGCKGSRAGPGTKPGRIRLQPFGTGPFFPGSSSIVAKVLPVAVAPLSSIREKMAPVAAHPYMSIHPGPVRGGNWRIGCWKRRLAGFWFGISAEIRYHQS